VWVFFLIEPPLDEGEVFEAFTMILIYFATGWVVWMLSAHLRRDAAELRANNDELCRTRDQLVAEERLAAVGRFASAIAHEIRNPVAAIASSLATAERDSLPQDLRAEMTRIALKEAGRLQQLTTDFLTYARSKPPQLAMVQVGVVIDYLLGLVRARAEERSVAIEGSCPASLAATMDEFQIHRAMLNLVMNAIDATPAGGRVRIGAQNNGVNAPLILFVENNGAAISADAAAHVFEPFFTTKATGTGLGLAIARNIAAGHGGSLTLAANEPGRVRFELSLPAGAEIAVGTAEPAPAKCA
jgi:signal transduction histidine kinase